jgi:hypothetical protein
MDMLGFPENFKRVPVTGLAEGQEGDVAVDYPNNLRYAYTAGRWSRMPIQNMLNVAKVLTYASDGDTNGLNYFLGTQYGTTTWANPFPASGQSGNTWTNILSSIVMSVSGYLGGQTDPPGITDRAVSHVHVSSTGHWVKWDFGVNGSMVVTYWNLQNRDNSADGATSVSCEGSNDGTTWVLLNQNTARSAAINVWAGGVVTDPTAYRYVRIRKNVDTDYFTIGEIELYGTLFYTPR